MIAIIGGSGFYNFIEDSEIRTIETPFGSVEVEIGKIGSKVVVFIPRHGKEHDIPPSNINYRANIYSINKLKVDYIIATNAVGSVNQQYVPGDLVIADDIIDFTNDRECTFFDRADFEIELKNGKVLSGVVHADVTHTYHPLVRDKLIQASKDLENKIHHTGTMVVSNGPRFETAAEIKAYSILGGDFVGMTSAPEAFLARELEIPYATIAVITNYGAGLQESVSAEEVFELFSKKIATVKKLIERTIILD